MDTSGYSSNTYDNTAKPSSQRGLAIQNISGSSPAPVSAPKIWLACEQSENLLASITALVQELEKRISGILTPVGPSNDHASDKPSSSASALTDRINQHNGRLVVTMLYLQSLLGRLEV